MPYISKYIMTTCCCFVCFQRLQISVMKTSNLLKECVLDKHVQRKLILQFIIWTSSVVVLNDAKNNLTKSLEHIIIETDT